MPRNKHYFISDLHLGAAYIADRRAHEERVVRFLRTIENDAKTLYLLGDVLDYWYEYRTVVPRGYVRFFGQLARMADAGIEITWFIGNHDIWLFDYLRDELGIRIVDAPQGGIKTYIEGTGFYLGHGDTFGPQPRSYLFMRSLFHSRLCQKLYSGIHPRWTIPFAHGWSSHSRKGNAETENTADSKALAAATTHAAEMAAGDADLRYIIIGHHHTPLEKNIGPNCRFIILGDWLARGSYAVFDGTTLRLLPFND